MHFMKFSCMNVLAVYSWELVMLIFSRIIKIRSSIISCDEISTEEGTVIRVAFTEKFAYPGEV